MKKYLAKKAKPNKSVRVGRKLLRRERQSALSQAAVQIFHCFWICKLAAAPPSGSCLPLNKRDMCSPGIQLLWDLAAAPCGYRYYRSLVHQYIYIYIYIYDPQWPNFFVFLVVVNPIPSYAWDPPPNAGCRGSTCSITFEGPVVFSVITRG